MPFTLFISMTAPSPIPRTKARPNKHKIWVKTNVLTFFFHLSSIYLFLIDLYWSIIASQYCVSFCCTTKRISHMHTHVPISPNVLTFENIGQDKSCGLISSWLPSFSLSSTAWLQLPELHYPHPQEEEQKQVICPGLTTGHWQSRDSSPGVSDS